jgi:hypothetical protein
MDDQSPFSVTPDADFLPGAKILLVETRDSAPGAKSTVSLVKNINPGPIIHWGANNSYPKDTIALANQSPELLSHLSFLATVLYGGGLKYEINANYGKKGAPVFEQAFDQEIQDWLQANVIEDYLLESIIDFTWFNQCFEELIKTKKGDKICQLIHQESTFCRMGIQNPKTGFNDKVYINANWPNVSADDKTTDIIAAIDPYDIGKVQYAKDLPDYKFIYPISYSAPGKIVYQQPGWHALFPSGWVDISVLIPIMKKSMMKFQMTIKYIIEVPEEFWNVKAKESLSKAWKDCSVDEKSTIKTSTKNKMNEFLTGAENAGKSFITTFGWDPISKSVIPGIKITALDDKLKDGKYIEDSKEASGQTLRALGIPLPLIGPVSSGDMGAGSGSDARIHFNILNKRLKSYRDKILAPLNFVAQYNGWTKRLPSLRFAIEDFVIDTLDVSHSTTNPAPNPTQKPDGPANN